MGCSLGFRPPQFSEDLAWLPGWLQQHQAEQFDEHIKKPQTPELAFKDLASFQGNTDENKYANLLSREEGRVNNCHLFLSGEDNSPISSSPSPGNVLHFHLHLSSYGDSQYSPTQQLDTSKKLLQSNKVLSTQLVKHSVGSGEKTRSIMHCSAGGQNLLPASSIQRTVENVCPTSPHNDKDSERHYGEKFSFRFLKGADVNEAVELSITASEALVIHELVKSGSTSETLPTESVLEVALQVKKARLDILEDAFHCPTEHTDNCDSLSDFDDVAMADAYEDVGLSYSVPDHQCACDSAISHIKETPLSDDHYGCDNIMNCLDVRAQQANFDDSPAQKHLEENVDMDMGLIKDFPLESLDRESQKKLSCDPVLVSNNSKLARYADSMLHQSVQENSDGLSIAQEVDISAVLKQNNGKNFPKCFLETSFLSESADIAPDENSFVQKHKSQSKLGSQSSIPFEGLHNKAREGILLSQDVVTSSNLSYVDPLCSVVPCSISTENAGSTLAQDQNDGEKCFRSTRELGVENLQRTLDQNIELELGDEQAMYTVHVESSGVTARRQLTSLKTYSMLLPKHVPLLEEGCHYFNQSWGSTKFLCLRTVSKNAAGTNNEDNHKTTSNRSSVAEVTNQKRNYDEIAGEGGEFLVQPLEQRTSPLALNQRSCPKHVTLPGSIVKHQQCKSRQNVQSECFNSHDKHASVKKQVRFSEAEDLPQWTKNVQKRQSLHQNCSTVRASKRQKLSKPCSIAYGMKSCLTNYCVKVRKRLIFQGIEFLVTGFSSVKGKEIEGLICKYGGMVLWDIPSPPKSREKRSSRSICQHFPVILCLKKIQDSIKAR
ncbi:uncharacterized protein LOC132189899 isoform X4 [Corylus avellana]|uniref:uncharacterized protein LOC132189899 isoform X4 n=1 Tax=Corylus avellana TaxID=13451 RepID=UPI00286C2869|nr:uncharacterized protein LOC132189899 isoform X4 [Corylus avellana]